MKNLIAAVAIMIMLGFSLAAFAAKPWTFAGIELGAPLADSNLPSCPLPTSVSSSWTPPTAICITSIGEKSADGIQLADLDGLNALHWPEIYASNIVVWNNRVEAIRIRIGRVAFDTVRQILMTRYGKPASSDKETVTSNAGAVVTSAKITWRESGNTVILSERCERVDRSCVDVANDATMIDRARAEKQSAAADASIL